MHYHSKADLGIEDLVAEPCLCKLDRCFDLLMIHQTYSIWGKDQEGWMEEKTGTISIGSEAHRIKLLFIFRNVL